MRFSRKSLRFFCLVVMVVLTALYLQFFVFHVIISRHDRHHHGDLMGLQGLSLETRNNNNKNSKNNNVFGGEAAALPEDKQAVPLPAKPKKQPAQVVEERCAINLYGLPRAFESIVLPSLIQNVIQPNAQYHCDYFIHYYNLTNESLGRFGQGGRNINPDEILLVRDNVLDNAHPYDSATVTTVAYGVTQKDDFWQQYATVLEKIHNTKDSQTGRYLYFPWKAQTYTFPTTVDNIIKMWHSIQSAWNLMERHAAVATANGIRIRYTRVAMLRCDVFYLTPIDIWAEAKQSSSASLTDGSIHHHKRNVANNQVVIPGFGKHPVSDRLIYGPYDAVKIWATTRFASLEAHAQYMHDHNPGWAMHSERFVQREILSRIENETKFQVMEHDNMCFFRARVDESIWITDCGGDRRNSIVIPTLPDDMKGAVERILGRSCGDIVQVTGRFKALQCPKTNQKILAEELE
jgi:hypothetical protein